MQSFNQPHSHLVSIIIPIYNVAPYLSECIQSVLTQSYENLDIILVDDGSSDESLEIALEFAKKDKRIFVISKPNGGQATARNYGIEFIKGSALREFFDSCHTEGIARSISNGNDRDSSLRTNASLRMTNDLDISAFAKPQYDNKNLVSNDNVHCHTERSEVSHIQSLSQTHSFAKTYKSLSAQEVQSHFKKLQPNFIKSDLERINDFITQELPKDALIHFIDSDDYIEPRCIEICVQNLREKDLDIFVHNWSDFDEETKTLSKGAYMGKLKKNSYESGLELLSHNKIYNFFFAWQGLFRASILNHYALRYTEGIYHEDHDFGTLLFALAKRSAYSDEALYVYRKRAGSIMNNQRDVAMPPKLPSFLEPLRGDFESYKEMRAYFKAYCFVVVGFRLNNYHKIDRRERQFFGKTIQSCIKPYIDDFYNVSSFYTPSVKDFLAKMGYKNITLRHFYFLLRNYWRNPKKFLRLFGLREKNAKS
ncbi:glycosyltransferase family A protein [Helicobacter sp. MIT 01-3238]|uniref:glycosyltransferase family 2 protein n=1 Tax=Helicobacter sp. MIT 01-3238 TaxID=398627 RepID=UPI000E1F9833|nr:glycosyltransferase family A protein [Helicobacter sp. MIT 01-3238]RDU55188.1 hypothetical protein CQA40_01810 [Helicobacter sp. MIT 01-3238]